MAETVAIIGTGIGGVYLAARLGTMLHVANCIANAGRIENGDNYKFYAEGVTPAVARLY